MFPPSRSAADEREVLKATMAAQGLSVVELERSGTRRPWHYVRGASRNRRMAARTPFTMTGPATGSHLLKTADDPSGRRVVGTFGNCSGGTTPWGIVLSGEENFDNYFGRSNRSRQPSLRAEEEAEHLRVGGRRPPLRRHCAGLCSRAPPVRLHHRDRSLRSQVDAAQGSPGICSSSAGTPRRRIPTSPAGRAQSHPFPVRTMSPSIRLATCGLPPTAPLLRYPRRTDCSGCRWRVPTADMWCSSSPCQSRPKPAVRSFMIVWVGLCLRAASR